MNSSKRPNWLMITTSVLLLTITGCHPTQASKPYIDDQGQTYPSGAAKKNMEEHSSDCCLCGTGKGTLIPTYRKEDNLGIISLNSFQLTHIEINRYNDNGKLIKEPSPTSTQIMDLGENGFSTFISADPNRGYATGLVSLGGDEKLDLERAASFLCTGCLSNILEQSWDNNPYGIGIINFKTGEIRLFEENVTAFIFGNFYISCKLNEKDTDKKEMELLIFYCPERYE